MHHEMSVSASAPSQIAGFTVLPLSLPPLPSFPVAATHYLYCAPHRPKIPTPSASRSLFLVNVPFDATTFHFKNLFSAQLGLPAGRVEDVDFGGGRKRHTSNSDEVTIERQKKQGKKRKSGDENGPNRETGDAALPPLWDRDLHAPGSTAVVLFVDRPSMDAALKAAQGTRKKSQELVWGEGVEGKVPALGSSSILPPCSPHFEPGGSQALTGYLNHHRLSYPSTKNLLESVDAYMTNFAQREAALAKSKARQRQEADEDGFVVVTKGGRTNPPRQEAAQALALRQKDKQNGLEDFYRFQSREQRKAKATELVRKFQEDKEKVRKMKDRRGRFKVSSGTIDESEIKCGD